jgi:carboxylesterase type B
MIDGVTLTDTMTKLYQAGKAANVPVIIGTVNDERAEFEARSNTTLSIANNQVWNLTDTQVQEAATFYPVDANFGYASPDNYFLTEFKAYIQSLSQFGENGCHANERMVGRYMSDKFGSEGVWTYRFNAPGKMRISHSPFRL